MIAVITVFFWALLARPTELYETETVSRDGIDIQVVLDVSRSMIATDIQPSRIVAAKEILSDFLWELSSDRVGIVLFAGKPFTSVPLSFDYDFLIDFVSGISVDTIDQRFPSLLGTAIGDGMILAADGLLRDTIEREKIMILIADGEANTGVDPLVALKYLKDKSIKTYTIWVWKSEDTFIETIDGFGIRGKSPVQWVDETTLREISSQTGGKYYRADSPETLREIFTDISKLETTPIEVEVFVSEQHKYTEVLFLMLLLYMMFVGIYFVKKIEV